MSTKIKLFNIAGSSVTHQGLQDTDSKHSIIKPGQLNGRTLAEFCFTAQSFALTSLEGLQPLRRIQEEQKPLGDWMEESQTEDHRLKHLCFL